MKVSKATAFVTTAVLTVSLTGCTGQMVATSSGPMPDYCTSTLSNAAGGAVIGSLLGAALGAAVGGGRGALIGAAVGAGAGTLTGAQMDANCRQYAMQNFTQLLVQQAAAQRTAMAQSAPVPPQPPQLASFDYYAPSPTDGQAPVHHRITQTSTYTNAATNEICSPYTEFLNGSQPTVKGTMCVAPNGTAHPA